MSRKTESESSSEVVPEARRLPRLGRSMALVWVGGILLILGVIISAAFTWIGSTEAVLGYIADHEAVRLFFVVIGGLVAVVGFVMGLAGRFGANSVLLLREMSSTAKTMDDVLGRSKTRFIFRR